MYRIIQYSLRHKFVVFLFVFGLIGAGIHALLHIPIGAVPDITNNQVQVITTSRNLATAEVERFLTVPVELEMGNLPGVLEIRSISKFGLSVVTVVFEDEMGTYLPRQLIAEKLGSIQDNIPEGFGSPSMGPISTGLGEIYQYTLDVQPDYRDRYDVTDLRTIQDWVVKRQLNGIPGVVEVNTWGGFLKTYEVAVDPMRLKNFGLSLEQVYESLQAQNTITGGGYIEKTHEAYFIRADGLIKDIDQVSDIVITHRGTAPIRIRDIATVEVGHATRFGAITGNGEGEKVLGQVMMLKGADSKRVIDAVVQRVDEVQATLPEGVYINPFLDRSDLIARTTMTIGENLILGFLIVLLVVVFLLGSWRSGLVVASVIPLTLLFALTLMYYFGIDANLMSLGAIDFGIIIDGAIIIVEYVSFLLIKNSGALAGLSPQQRQSKIDAVVGQGAHKMMHSAFFGQVIIIIVFIPILTLSGIEGKMFRPMALTFIFALLGAMILCFTYVPVAASLLLSSTNKPYALSTWVIKALNRIYRPILTTALQAKYAVIGLSLIALVATLALFTRMGGEFVPTLDEGDFVIQPVLKTGMSLSETVKMTTRIEQILKRLPEVNQVVSRIGAAEVPTDPMSMEESDVIITLKDRREWSTATTKDQLAEQFKEAITREIPGIEIEFTQPIEMRFNELISGARADLAIKIYGDDIEVLYQKANEIQQIIDGVEGAADISIEKIDGLPEIIVDYHRDQIARYGISVGQLNDILSMGVAGKKAGEIYQGERKYDLVLRYDQQHRSDISHIRSAVVDLPDGRQVPLSTFADIRYSEGPAKISRDDTHRRVVVGINVRGKDLQSVVDDIKDRLEDGFDLPTGYRLTYGGQFENLQQASQRLLLAVPFALALILILLYFAFKSVRQVLLIATAIPLATIGGILALYLRGMPFSISAGIGFIALFGIAVLNGVVLIEHFKELENDQMDGLDHETLIRGAMDRVRPVLLTALAAALGFLPMAISTSAGAEVQRPLATVVIGGLFTSTLLTLVVLPVLYALFARYTAARSSVSMVLLGICMTGLSVQTQAQTSPLTLDQVITLSQSNNAQYQTALLEAEREKVLMGSARDIAKTDIYYGWDRNNLTIDNSSLHILGVSQDLKLPGYYRSKRALQQSKQNLSTYQSQLVEHTLEGKVRALFDKISYHYGVAATYRQLDSTLSEYQQSIQRKATLGAATDIEVMAVHQRKANVSMERQLTEWQLSEATATLQQLINSSDSLILSLPVSYETIDTQRTSTYAERLTTYYQELDTYHRSQATVYDQETQPEVLVEVFGGVAANDWSTYYPGVQLGLAVPLSKKASKARQEATQIDQAITQLQQKESLLNLHIRKRQITGHLAQLQQQLNRYERTTMKTSSDLLRSGKRGLAAGQITHLQYLMLIEEAMRTELRRLELIHTYNQSSILLQYSIN